MSCARQAPGWIGRRWQARAERWDHPPLAVIVHMRAASAREWVVRGSGGVGGDVGDTAGFCWAFRVYLCWRPKRAASSCITPAWAAASLRVVLDDVIRDFHHRPTHFLLKAEGSKARTPERFASVGLVQDGARNKRRDELKVSEQGLRSEGGIARKRYCGAARSLL